MIELRIEQEKAVMELYPESGTFTLLDVPTIKSLIKKFEEVAKSPAKTLCVYGHGNCFAVGADLKSLYKYDGYEAKGFSILGNRLFRTMREMPQAIIALIDGFCMGGGMDFSAACDFRLSTKESKFAHPGTKLGIITGFGGTQALSRLMKSSYKWELLATGDIFAADFMKESGFLIETFDNTTDMKAYAQRLCTKIASKPRNILAFAKESIY